MTKLSLHFYTIIFISGQYISPARSQCDNICSGSCAPQSISAKITGAGSVSYVWLDPIDTLASVEVYFVSFSTSGSGPWTSVNELNYAKYPAFDGAPPCDTQASITCNRGTLQGLDIGTNYFLKVSAGRCCMGWALECQSCSDLANCPISGDTVTSFVAMGTRKHVFSFSYSTFRLTRSIPRTGFPSAPVGLQGQITGNRSLRLSWQLPSNTGTLVQVSSDIISFQVTRSLDANFSSSLVNRSSI
jgi:hypothetical protein